MQGWASTYRYDFLESLGKFPNNVMISTPVNSLWNEKRVKKTLDYSMHDEGSSLLHRDHLIWNQGQGRILVTNQTLISPSNEAPVMLSKDLIIRWVWEGGTHILVWCSQPNEHDPSQLVS